MKSEDSSWLYLLLGIVLILVAGAGAIYVAGLIWNAFIQLDTDLAKALVAAATTVIVTGFTVTIGRYLERKKEIEARFHQTKVDLYDEFLVELFKVFNASRKESLEEPDELVEFLVEWQRKMLLWSDGKALAKYIEWKNSLGAEPTAQNVTLLETFILEMRKDLGLSNRKIPKGILAYMILKNPELFLQLSATNPSISLAEVAKREIARTDGNES